MNSSKKLRRSRVQTSFDPYELPLFSDSSCGESSEDDGRNDPIQPDGKQYKAMLGPYLQMDHSKEFEDPISRKRGVKRKRPSEHIRPLSDYLYHDKRKSNSESYELPSNPGEIHASLSQPNSDMHGNSQEYRVPTSWNAQVGQFITPVCMRNFADADKGKLNLEGFIPNTPYYPDHRNRPSTQMNPIPPDVSDLHKALAKDTDHLSQEHITPDPNLPKMELVKALHAYASNFYAYAIPSGGEIDYCSMDASALIVMAKLLETTVETIIGNTGDLAFTERAGFEENGGPRRFYKSIGSWGPRVLEKGTFDYWELLNSQRELTKTGRASKLAQNEIRGASGRRSSRKSCVPCCKQKNMCDHGQPCARCIALERVDHCVYEPDSGIFRSQSRGKRSCKPCYQQKRACNHGHPCATCSKYCREDQCIYDSDSQNEDTSSKLSLFSTSRDSRSASANSSKNSNGRISDLHLEEHHSEIGTDDEDDETKVEAIALAVRGRPVTRSSSRGRRSENSWNGRTPSSFRLKTEEKIEVDMDSLHSDRDQSTSHRHDPRVESARHNTEMHISQHDSNLSGKQFGIGHDTLLTAYESDSISSDADESNDEDVLLSDDD